MVGVIVATHGELGTGLLSTLRMILGPTEGLLAVSLTGDDSRETFQVKIEEALLKVDPKGEGALALVDMLGGTPFNVCLQLAQKRRLHVVTGVNLPMLVKAATGETSDLKDSALEIRNAGRDGVVTSVDLLNP